MSSLNTPKAMFDALTKLFEGNNINKKMALRNELKNVKIQNVETIQYYFTRVSQIKEQLELVYEEVENAEIVMTTLNGLARSWDSFIQGICARKKLVKTMGRVFSRRILDSSLRRKDGKWRSSSHGTLQVNQNNISSP